MSFLQKISSSTIDLFDHGEIHGKNNNQVRILLIESEEKLAEDIKKSMRQFNEGLFGEAGFFVEHLKCLEDVKKAKNLKSYDCIILDLDLIDSRGLTTLQRLLPTVASAPIIALINENPLTGYCVKMKGAKDYIFKEQITGHNVGKSVKYALGDSFIAERTIKTGNSYTNIFMDNPDGIIVMDMEGRILFTNNSACNILNMQSDKMIGEMFGIPIFNGESSEIEIIKNKKIKYAEIRVIKTTWENREALLASVRDISDRKEMELKVINLNHELEGRVIQRTKDLEDALKGLKEEINIRKKNEQELIEARDKLSRILEKERDVNKMKSNFVSMISHEYKTPLQVILSSSSLVRKYVDKGDKEKILKHIERIELNIMLMNHLIEDTLCIGEFDSYSRKLKIESLNLADLCNNIIDEIQQIDRFKCKIKYVHSTDMIIIKSDKTLFNQIVSNLLSNAVKYSEKNSEIILSTEIDGDIVEIVVINKGIGIENIEKEKIFEPFYRSQNTGNIPGTGLGLAILKKSVDALKGKADVNSSNGKTTFKVIIPNNIK